MCFYTSYVTCEIVLLLSYRHILSGSNLKILV